MTSMVLILLLILAISLCFNISCFFSIVSYKTELRNHTVYRQFLETRCGLERKDDRVGDRLKEHNLTFIERKY